MSIDATSSPRTEAPERGRIKGAAFREFVAWIEQDRGAEALARIVSSLPAESQRPFQVGRPALGLLAATWYPAELVHERAMKCQDLEVHREGCVSDGDPVCSWVITWSDR